VRLVGGGTRRQSKLPDQVPLAPDHVGLTERPQPTLHWYSQGDADVRVDFVLIAEGAVRPRLEFTIGETIGRGFHSIDLGEHDVELEPGVEYRWYVVLIPDPRHRSADVVGGGAIRRVDSLGPGHDWAELARRGVWYDAIAELSDALAGDPSLGPARAELLEAVGLDSIATHDRR